MKAIIFDIGRVLLDFDYDIAIEKCNKRANKNIESFGDIYESTLFLDYHRGVISDDDLYRFFVKNYGYFGSQVDLADDFGAAFTRIEKSLEYFETIKKHPNVKVGILSDNHGYCERWMKNNLTEVFSVDSLVLSHHTGYIKPELDIYRLSLDQLKLPPENCLFIDDREVNIEGALKLGITGVVHMDLNRTVSMVDQFILSES